MTVLAAVTILVKVDKRLKLQFKKRKVPLHVSGFGPEDVTNTHNVLQHYCILKIDGRDLELNITRSEVDFLEIKLPNVLTQPTKVMNVNLLIQILFSFAYY